MFCEKEYVSKNRNSKFCSKECYAESLKKEHAEFQIHRKKPGPKKGNRPWNKIDPVEKVCECCGEPFSTIRSEARFCSKECYSVWRKEHPKKTKSFAYHVVCKNCGKEFGTSNKDQQFCCVKCTREYQWKGYEYNNYITKVCPVCGKEFKVKQGLRDQIYCSLECRYQSQIMYDEGKRVRQRNTAQIRRKKLKDPLPRLYLEALLIAQKGRCIYCGKEMGDDKTIDHIRPVCKGGKNDKYNLVYCCKKCNSSKGTKDFVDYIMEKHKASVIDDSMIIQHNALQIENKLIQNGKQ